MIATYEIGDLCGFLGLGGVCIFRIPVILCSYNKLTGTKDRERPSPIQSEYLYNWPRKSGAFL